MQISLEPTQIAIEKAVVEVAPLIDYLVKTKTVGGYRRWRTAVAYLPLAQQTPSIQLIHMPRAIRTDRRNDSIQLIMSRLRGREAET